MTQPNRLKDRGRINRAKSLTFSFNGQSYAAYEGDSVASALLANGVALVGRSFKYHRPRGVVTAGSEEPNALLGVTRGPGRFEPNTRATMQDVFEGLQTESQNSWPSLQFDVGAVNDLLHRFLPAGFYYKTFMWPKSFWDKVYEPLIRKAAGLGRSPTELDPDRYSARYHHSDILVVGAGPAGLAAALAAARCGAHVTLVDEHAELGGYLLSAPMSQINGQPAWDWLRDTVAELEAMDTVRVLPRTTAIGYFQDNMVGLVQKVTDHLPVMPSDAPRERIWRVRARHVILAQGALEKPIICDGNDRPGVMLCSAALTYLHRYGVLVGHKPVVVTHGDDAWHTAFDMQAAGAQVAMIVDARSDVGTTLTSRAHELGIPVAVGATITGTKGRKRVCGVAVADLKAQSQAERAVPCDAVLMSGGWTPSLHLFSHTKGSLRWDDSRGTYLPDSSLEACSVVGAGGAVWGVSAALKDGASQGVKVARDLGYDGPELSLSADDMAVYKTAHTVFPQPEDAPHVRAFVDFQNDVTAKDIRLAVREGMNSIEHVKRYTTNGMATDQGKLSNINGLLIASDALGRHPSKVGLTTFRPPYSPTTFGALAGHHRGQHFDVERRTPIDAWAMQQGAVFEPVALWRRARYFPKAGEDMHAAVVRECKAVRSSVGLFDASTLGKIEVVGPDAATFMNRFYTNPWLKLQPGRCRYGLSLGEDGFIRDDGVIGRLAENHFHVTTTTGGAPRVLTMMEDYLQTEWPDLNVWLTSITEQWAVLALQGPNAGKVLAPLLEGLTLGDDTFPHMSVADCTVAGIPARLFRISFTGEVGFEVNVPARYGLKLWNILMEAGAAYDICPYGTETMHILRAEKGYIIVGQDTDGTVTPDDAGLNWAIGKLKKDFIGKRSLTRPDMLLDNRKQLVGLLTDDPAVVLEEGAQLVADPNQLIPMTMIGHVTSSYWSEALGRSIALALVEGGRSRKEDIIYVPMPDKTHAVKVVEPIFYDPAGENLKMRV